MEDDKLRDLFMDFEPELPSDQQFMNRVQQNLNTIEMIRQQANEAKNRNKKAVAIAAFTGFIVGILFSFATPYISQVVTSIPLAMQQSHVMKILANVCPVITWIIIGAISVFTALNTYEVSLFIMKPNKTSIEK